MKHRKCSVEDIAQDKSFRDWVLSEDREGADYWNRWASKDPERQNMIREARILVRKIRFQKFGLSPKKRRDLWHRIGSHASMPDMSGSGKQVDVKAGLEDGKTTDTAGHTGKVRYLYTDRIHHNRNQAAGAWKKVAVATLLVGLIALFGWLTRPWQAADAETVWRTDFGEKRELMLEDGTEVVLNANTELRVVSGWEEQGTREVWLDGEAWFDVRRNDRDMPFVVHTRDIDAHVLGTSFNAYARPGRVRFELASGRLKLDNRQTSTALEMTPGDQIVYKDPAAEPVRRRIEAEEVGAWRENRLIFRRTPLEEIGELLSHNYGLNVIFMDESVQEQFFTGTVPSDDIDHLLATLSRTFDLHIERRERTVIIQQEIDRYRPD